MAVQRLSNSGRNGYSYKSLIAGITPIPSVPTIGTATELTYESATVEFTAPGDYSGSTYTATSSPGGLTGTSATSPIVVTGLSELTTYTFTVTATNATGTSGASAASNSITTPTAFTPSSSYDALASYTVPSGGVSSITFAGIPTNGQYKHLQLRFTMQHTSNAVSTNIAFNDDTTTGNYARHVMYGANNSTYSFGEAGSGSPRSLAYINNVSSNPAAGIVDLVDYDNTSKYKTLRTHFARYTSGDDTISFESKLWRSTDAVNKITLTVESGVITEHSKFSLYGVKG